MKPLNGSDENFPFSSWDDMTDHVISFLPHNRVNEYFSVTTLTDHIRKLLASKVPTSNGQERLKGRVRVLQIIETSIHFFVVPIKWNDLDWQKEKRKLKERISDKTSKESSKLIMPVTRSSIQLFWTISFILLTNQTQKFPWNIDQEIVVEKLKKANLNYSKRNVLNDTSEWEWNRNIALGTILKTSSAGRFIAVYKVEFRVAYLSWKSKIYNKY